MNTVAEKPSSAFPLWLLGCTALWGVGMWAWYANSHSKDGWSQTPLPWMLVLVATPFLCVVAAIALLRARHRSAQRLTWLDWCALVAGTVAVAVGALLLIMVAGNMRGMGIL
jgi:hypothetical protein